MVTLWGELPEGMKETPSRVVKYWVEMSQGIGVDPSESLSKVFDCGYDQVVIEKGIPFTRDLVNKKAEAKAEANTPKTETPKAGPVEKTDMPALIATLQKALHQCTLLNQSMLKGALVDAIVEFIPDFTESAK